MNYAKIQEHEQFNEQEDLELIKEQSKNWSVADWEKYLKTLEVAEREGMVSLDEDMDFSETQSFAEMICTSSIVDEFPLIYEKFGFLLDKLYPRQKQIITMIYWDNMKASEISDQLGVTRASVSKTHKQAIKRLELMFHQEMKKRAEVIKLEKRLEVNKRLTEVNSEITG